MELPIKTDYPFLAHPPQKKRPIHPLPSPPSPRSPPEGVQVTCRVPRCKSNSIAAWAAHVQPGSPASLSPRSPRRRPSFCRGRRPSIHLSSASFLHIAPTPTTAHLTTPSIRDFKADLTTVGYTSVFLQLPNTPISAALALSVKPSSPGFTKDILVPPVPSLTCKPRGLTRFRSFSVLRSRGRSKSICPAPPTKMKAKAAAASATIVKRKKAEYAARPPPLVNELALMQFADGGSMNDNIRRVMEAHAKATGSAGLADVYRDGEGGIWWDQDEEWEYAHLLAEGDEPRPYSTSDPRWVTFGDNTSPRATNIPTEERRGSISTQDSDLDPKYIVQPTDLLEADDLALFGSVVAPACKPVASVLTLPCRPRRAAKHLRKPDFLADMAFSQHYTSQVAAARVLKPKGKARRRPAPLKLSPSSPASKRPTNSPTDADKIRRDFIEASFTPSVSVLSTPTTPWTAVSATTPVDGHARFASQANAPLQAAGDGLARLGTKTKPSMLNMARLFRSARKAE